MSAFASAYSDLYLWGYSLYSAANYSAAHLPLNSLEDWNQTGCHLVRLGLLHYAGGDGAGCARISLTSVKPISLLSCQKQQFCPSFRRSFLERAEHFSVCVSYLEKT